MARLERWKSSDAAKWEVPRFDSRVGVRGESKISSFCF